MIFRYIISFYYWIAMYLCPSNITGLKHKNSDTTSYKEDEDIIRELERNDYNNSIELYMNNEEEQKIPLIRSQSERFPIYNCGYCNRKINKPEYMYNDKVFCTSRCRTNLIQREENYSVKKQCVSFSF